MEEEELKKEIVNILNIYGKEIEEVNRLRDVELNNGNDGIPPKPKDLGILPTII